MAGSGDASRDQGRQLALIFPVIFDDINRPAAPAGAPHRRRRRSRRREADAIEHPRRRSTFEAASNLLAPVRDRGDRSTAAWLWMLALLVVAVGGFAFFLQQQKSGRTALPGEAPSTELLPFIDPILAPLETGTAGYVPEDLVRVDADLQSKRDGVNRDDQEVFSVAVTIASILQEALQDRDRHLQRLIELGSPVIGVSEDAAPKTPAITEVQRQHLELAVGVSWQRNSGTYRDRVEELWYRLLRLEQGRFAGGSAPQSMMPKPHQDPANE